MQPTARRKAVMALFLLMALPSVTAAETASPIPASLAGDAKQLWRAVMNTYFGTYDRKAKCWIGKGTEGRYCMRPHTLDPVRRDNTTLRYISVAGQMIGEGDCHACAGRMAFLILKDTGTPTLSLLARSSGYIAIGGWGRAPAEDAVSLQRLGRDDSLGWAIGTGFTGQGVTYSSIELFGTIDDDIRSLGSIPQGYDESGNCTEQGVTYSTGEKCSSYGFEVTFGTGPARFAPITLTGTGQRQGEPFSSRITYSFDEATKTYTAPREDLPPEFQF